MDKELLLKMLGRVDLRGLLIEDVLQSMIYAKIDELVADSSNTIDDAIADLLKPLLKDKLEELLVEFVDGLKV